MPKGFPLTEEEQKRRQHDVFTAAIPLFLEKGFRETTMQDIAAAAGMGKSTLYDYFATKDEILVAYAEDAIFDLTVLVKEITAQEKPAAEILHEVMLVHLRFLLASKDFYSRLTLEVQRLNLASLQRIQRQRHAYQDIVCGLIERAIAEGSFRPVNPLLATRTLLTLLTPAVYTSRPTGTPEEMMNEILDIFYQGVKESSGRKTMD
jgi:TetR/AcrR family transcriptional regulator, cholesterol catabolism regulator